MYEGEEEGRERKGRGRESLGREGEGKGRGEPGEEGRRRGGGEDLGKGASIYRAVHRRRARGAIAPPEIQT